MCQTSLIQKSISLCTYWELKGIGSVHEKSNVWNGLKESILPLQFICCSLVMCKMAIPTTRAYRGQHNYARTPCTRDLTSTCTTPLCLLHRLWYLYCCSVDWEPRTLDIKKEVLSGLTHLHCISILPLDNHHCHNYSNRNWAAERLCQVNWQSQLTAVTKVLVQSEVLFKGRMTCNSCTIPIEN